MDIHDKLMIAYCWILTMFATCFLGHEIAMIKVEKEVRQIYQERIADSNKLINCQRLITENK